MIMENIIQVEWTGYYPALCNGEWIIKYNDIELTVPDDRKYSCMNTYNRYEEYGIEGDCYFYDDGLDELEWIEANESWITKMFEEYDIEVDEELLLELYNKIRLEDWRYGSCGGCV